MRGITVLMKVNLARLNTVNIFPTMVRNVTYLGMKTQVSITREIPVVSHEVIGIEYNQNKQDE